MKPGAGIKDTSMNTHRSSSMTDMTWSLIKVENELQKIGQGSCTVYIVCVTLNIIGNISYLRLLHYTMNIKGIALPISWNCEL